MSAVLAPAALAQLAEDLNRDDLALVARHYRADCAAMMAALRAAVADPVAWRRAAHRLAGAAGTVGALPLAARAREMTAGPLPADPAAALGQLQAACDASCEAFSAWVGAL